MRLPKKLLSGMYYVDVDSDNRLVLNIMVNISLKGLTLVDPNLTQLCRMLSWLHFEAEIRQPLLNKRTEDVAK